MAMPNWRNGAGTNCPQLFTSVDGAFQVGVLIRLDWGVTVFRRSLATGAVTASQDLSAVSSPNLVTYGITPIVSDALGGDDHNHISCALDDLNRMWVSGNSKGTNPLHTIYSAPNSLTSWTTLPTGSFPGWAGTSPYGNYNHWRRLSDGRLLWFINRRDAAAHDQGLEINGFVLPLNTTPPVWTQLATNGVLMHTDLPPAKPERVYLTGAFVESVDHPHPDRVWLAGVWRDDWADGATQHDCFVIYNDTVTNPATWKRIDGTAQSIPCTAANTVGTSAVVPVGTAPYWFGSGTLIVDRLGYPHLINFPSSGSFHVWWNGTAWQSETAGLGRPALHILANGSVWKQYASATYDKVVMTTTAGGDVHQFCPVPTPGGTATWTETFADPIQQMRGVLHVLIPDGDTPVICEVGNHKRAVAS